MSFSKFRDRLALLACAAFFSATSFAGPAVRYEIAHTVTQIIRDNCALPPSQHTDFGCLAVGDVYLGEIIFDSDLLASDGVKNRIGPFVFNMRFGTGFFSNVSPSLLSGGGGFRSQLGFDSSPGLVIRNGELVELLGDVYNSSDSTYVDWRPYSGSTPNTFVARDGVDVAIGTLSLRQIPEPAVSSLVLLGIGLLFYGRARKQAETSF